METALDTVVPDLSTDLTALPNAMAVNLNSLNTGKTTNLQAIGTQLDIDLSTENVSLLAALESRRSTLKTNMQSTIDTMDDQLREINTEEAIELDLGDLDSFNVTMQGINDTLLQSLNQSNNDLRDALDLENTSLLNDNTANFDDYVSLLQEKAGEAEFTIDQEFTVSKNQLYPYYEDTYFDNNRTVYNNAKVGLGDLPTERMDLNDSLDVEISQLDQVENLHDTVILNNALEVLRGGLLWNDVEGLLNDFGSNLHTTNAKILDIKHLESDEYNLLKENLYDDLDQEIEDTYDDLNDAIVDGINQLSTEIGQAKTNLTTEIDAAKVRADALIVSTLDSDGPRPSFTPGTGNWIDNALDNGEDFIEAGNDVFENNILTPFNTTYSATTSGFMTTVSSAISTRQANLNSILSTELATPSGSVQTVMDTNYTNLQTVISNNPTCNGTSETAISNQLTTLETNILSDLESLKTTLLGELSSLESSITSIFSSTNTSLGGQVSTLQSNLTALLAEEETELTTVSGLLNDIRNQFYSEFGFTDAQLNVLLGNIGTGLITLLDTFYEDISYDGVSDILTIHQQILQDTLDEYDSDSGTLGFFQAKYEETRDLEDLVNAWDLIAGRPDHLTMDYHSLVVNVLDTLYEIELAWTYGDVNDPTDAANWYTTGGFIPVDILDPVFQDYTFPEILDALRWLDLDIGEKNQEVLTGAFSAPLDGQDILRKSDFDGYELVEIIGEPSDLPPGEGMKLAFELGAEEETNVFKDAQFEEENFVKSATSPGTLSIFDEDFLGNVLAQPSGDDETNTSEGSTDNSRSGGKANNCSGKNLLTWPACFVQWTVALPTVFTKLRRSWPNRSTCPIFLRGKIKWLIRWKPRKNPLEQVLLIFKLKPKIPFLPFPKK
ncbi:hypothetical protein HC823_00930 [Candidatus Gracilibacteria bacterium]|nr:hypothetical protein [Candidatus Gracilibacteria bacterium]